MLRKMDYYNLQYVATGQNYVSRTAIIWNNLSNTLLSAISISSFRKNISNNISDPNKINTTEP